MGPMGIPLASGCESGTGVGMPAVSAMPEETEPPLFCVCCANTALGANKAAQTNSSIQFAGLRLSIFIAIISPPVDGYRLTVNNKTRQLEFV